MSITVDDVPAWTAQCLDVPQPTDPETARILAVLNRHRRDSSFSRLDTSDLDGDTGRRQPSDR